MKTAIKLLCLALSLAGAGVGVLLIILHSEAGGSDGVMASLCGQGGGCDRVLASRWAYLPPLAEDGAAPVGFAVPVALLGVAYFCAFAVWFGGFGWSSPAPRSVERAVAVAALLGGAASVAFLLLMALVIKGLCPWCLASHLINFAMLGSAFWLFSIQRRVRGEFGDSIRTIDTRSLALGGALVLSLWSGTVLGYRLLGIAAENGEMKTALGEIQRDSARLELAFYGQETSEIALREDEGAEGWERDPTLDVGPGYRNTLVVFGDAECSACRRFHGLLDREIRPAYGEHLRVVFKHLPLSDLHPEALTAARALEAARAQGMFWKMLEALYERQDALAGLDFGAMATDLGMDRDQFLNDMDSETAKLRIQEDLALAERLGIEGTPAVFLNGRRVSGAIRNLTAFWQSQADRLRAQREEKGQGWNPAGMAGAGH